MYVTIKYYKYDSMKSITQYEATNKIYVVNLNIFVQIGG